ncbi:hypothetical protein A5761_09995 [Mycolicibacterium setense]|nr:hypothetical protein A5761_09995 [Mycolicibacterium setense]
MTGSTESLTAASSPPAADLSAASFWSLTARERDEAFALLRKSDPISRQPKPETGSGLMPTIGEYWAVVRHSDIRYVSRNPQLFCSSQGVLLDEVPPAMRDVDGPILGMDAPRHARLRSLITAAFTPRHVRQISDQINAQAEQIVSDAIGRREVEIVRDVSMRLPLWTISEMLGVPEEEQAVMYHAANVVTGTRDEEFVPAGTDPMMAMMGAMGAIHQLSYKMEAERRAEPRDDLMTSLVQAEVDGQALTAEEIAWFVLLLFVAGNDTTRNTISHGVKAFSDFPEQWDLLRSNPDAYLDTAVEELIRWASPVILFRRTATQDTELGGRAIREGDPVVLFYSSANRDEDVFERPWEFDITRKPNEHLGFGGGGPHFCLGALIARTQLKAIFGLFAKSVTRFEAGELDTVVGNLIHGVRSLPCVLRLDNE